MYYRQTENGYIVAIGQTESVLAQVERISEAEYQQLVEFLAQRPAAPQGYGYRPKSDLTWEQYALPPAPEHYTQAELSAMTNAALEQLLYRYGISANMNKENLVRLVLAAQEEGAAS